MAIVPRPSVLAHCDWSKDPKKRWMTIAILDGEVWSLNHPEPVGDVTGLINYLQARSVCAGAVLIGFDFPIGLPSRYGESTGFPDFKFALNAFGTSDWAQWFDVCNTLTEISPRRPFYPVRPGGRRRDHLTQALGLSYDDLLRQCERPTGARPAACSLFWTLGGNQVGKGAITGWREVLLPNLASIGLWPFDGNLGELLVAHDVVFAETYPGEVYGQIHLPAKSGWSKKKQAGRASVAASLLNWTQERPVRLADGLMEKIREGFSPRSIGEDQFDALVGLLGMIDVIEGQLVEGSPVDDRIRRWEGWILGQTASGRPR